MLLTFNEEKNLPSCFSALEWCDDVVVLDSGSTDRTVAIAKSNGARVLERPFDDFAGQRNWGLDNGDFVHEWVLHLDADEITTPEFIASLSKAEPDEGIDAYQIPSKMMLFGRWIKHAGMYPTYQVRLGHRDRLRFKQVGHGQREDLPAERVAIFDTPYLHYSFSHGLFGWLQKHVRYARDEAALIFDIRNGSSQIESGLDATSRRRSAKSKAAKLPVTLRPILRFLYIYFWKQGFRDGRAGFAYALMLSVYEGMTAIFVLEALMGTNAMPKPSKTGSIEK
ncbi:hypothetical protein HY17_18800 [Hyphomonas sp. CY54-11-8]|nr:hypothetical protein HY17_18800 [Hyphomonas sp. CY54-11-8]